MPGVAYFPGALIVPSSAVTFCPGRARWMPSITMRSVGARPERNRVRRVTRRLAHARRGKPQVADEVRLAAIKGKMDGVHRHNRREQRSAGLASGDQIAGVDTPVGDAPRDRCAHLAPFEVEL